MKHNRIWHVLFILLVSQLYYWAFTGDVFSDGEIAGAVCIIFLQLAYLICYRYWINCND